MSTPGNNDPVALRLIDREFLIACAPEEREGLVEAAALLDRKMRELRANARAPSFERLAVLAAVSMTHELLALRKQQGGDGQQTAQRLATMRQRLEFALENADTLHRETVADLFPKA
ncbi:cell division protein ZapA [Rhodanobacter sp. DHG33]|uniref:cell division protein ZapA n=1 Tax=Rhodanobacter sp. DHG33 TaxID=2775921 RepID=UPI00177D57D5|nr:cell division protein ZapA [Rhodanobacter sp. DHG33]MBD8897506.1 cell division protein ZapA [Rhodanobacter sp. DHG33]